MTHTNKNPRRLADGISGVSMRNPGEPLHARSLGDLKGRKQGHRLIPESRVEAQCWCQSGYVRITTAMVRAGETASCGRRACYDPRPRTE